MRYIVACIINIYVRHKRDIFIQKGKSEGDIQPIVKYTIVTCSTETVFKHCHTGNKFHENDSSNINSSQPKIDIF